VTTADDLVRLVRGLADKRVLSRRAWAHFVGTHRLEDGEVLRYAHGLSSTRLDSFEGFTFGGANGHERLHVVHFPGLDLTVALTADCGDGVLPALAERLVREVFDLPLAEVSDRTAPAGLLERCTGHYQLGCNRLEVRATDDAHLELVSAERPTYRLLYQGGDSFVAEVDHGLWLQFQVDNGHARSFVLTERGVDAVVVRVDEKR
jgi:hypothetical protein